MVFYGMVFYGMILGEIFTQIIVPYTLALK